MKRWTDKVHLIAAGTLLGMTAIAYGIGVHPILSDRKDEARLAADHQAAKEDHAVLQNDIRAISQETDRLEQSQAEAQVSLEDAGRINERLVELRALARQNTLRMDGLKPGEPEYDEDYGIVRIHLDGRARFGDVLRFIRDLRREFQDVTVRAVNIRADRDPLERPQFGLELNWFVRTTGAST